MRLSQCGRYMSRRITPPIYSSILQIKCDVMLTPWPITPFNCCASFAQESVHLRSQHPNAVDSSACDFLVVLIRTRSRLTVIKSGTAEFGLHYVLPGHSGVHLVKGSL